MSERPTCELCGHPMPDGEEMFKFHGYSGPCPGPRTKPMGGVPEVIELHGEKWVRIDVVRKQEQRLAAAESDLRSTVANLKTAHDGKAIAETAAFFLLEVVKHTDPVRYNEAFRHWPFLEAAKGGRDEI